MTGFTELKGPGTYRWRTLDEKHDVVGQLCQHLARSRGVLMQHWWNTMSEGERYDAGLTVCHAMLGGGDVYRESR